MLYVALSGILGFFVFDCYRVHYVYSQKGVYMITFGSFLGILVHISVYIAAGILALFVNLDTMHQCCSWQWLPTLNQDMVGPLVRGFGIGLAGPAGLSKAGGDGNSQYHKKTNKAFDESTPGPRPGPIAYLDALLMR
jgi:hypothetical protein